MLTFLKWTIPAAWLATVFWLLIQLNSTLTPALATFWRMLHY